LRVVELVHARGLHQEHQLPSFYLHEKYVVSGQQQDTTHTVSKQRPSEYSNHSKMGFETFNTRKSAEQVPRFGMQNSSGYCINS
jgi:hypothetical protein